MTFVNLYSGSVLFVFRVFLCHIVLSVPCSLVVCWERTDLLVLLCVMFSCDFVTFLYGVLGQVWYLVVSIPDLCLLPYFVLFFKLDLLRTIVKSKRLVKLKVLFTDISNIQIILLAVFLFHHWITMI